jgi:DNA-binding NarL/FixJ family response regulator
MYMPGKLPMRTPKRQTRRPSQEALSRPTELTYEQAIRAVQAHLDRLQQRVAEGLGALDAVLSEAFEELRITLEELHTADEERHRQHEELASTRQIVEGERRRYQELFDFAPHGYLLTDRELQVLCMLGSGKTVTSIAAELSLSVKTISTYRRRILEKMHLRTNAELIRYAVHHELMD